ncbi:MAG: tRNA pseudouridine(38-40) synthase TruA [Christensenellales bacterium]|jgi:tRNA pseudouridine38-40 synthase
MRRIKLVIEYDGTNYAGWQRQENGVTVQQLIEENIQKVTGERVTLHGSGRTDSGVHALGQVAHFDTGARMPAEKFCYALNTGLPDDIRIIDSCEVSSDFHARFSAKRKHYRYAINNGAHASALYRNFELHVHKTLDVAAMKEAAKVLVGTHDFSAFKAVECKLNAVRTIYRSEISTDGNRITYDIEGNGFLYNMVRIIVGTLVEIGKGKLDASDMERILLSKDRSNAGPTAPAKGLTLVSVEYPEESHES